MLILQVPIKGEMRRLFFTLSLLAFAYDIILLPYKNSKYKLDFVKIYEMPVIFAAVLCVIILDKPLEL